MKYILKNGEEIESIPIGRSSVNIGEKSPDGMLTVVARAPNANGRAAKVICQCQCGNFTTLSLNAFRNGSTKSCGCYNKEIHKKICQNTGKQSYYKDYTKIDNPYYNFIQRLDEKDSNNSNYWIVECKKCKNKYKVVPAQLISNARRKGLNPCDCWRYTSKGMLKIDFLLKENNIQYEKEKQFKDCISPKGNLMKFDFFINDNYIIEYDGEQHFIEESFGDSKISGKEKLIKQKQYDTIKNEYCFSHNIPLIRIPYTHYKDIVIEDLQLETTKFLVKENYGN